MNVFGLFNQTISVVFWLLCLACCQGLLAGCSRESLEYTEVKRIDEKVTESELKTFLRIIDALPDKKLPQFPPVFAPPPEWNQARTLEVGELVDEEIKLGRERSDVEKLAQSLQRNRSLGRVLRREQITLQQFIGLTLAIGVAFSRNTLRDDQDLEKILKQGQTEIKTLKRDTRPFHALKQEGMHEVLRRAVWITRVDRADRLKLVPPENLDLVERHQEALAAVLPAEFTGNPLDAVADLLEKHGMPFEELSEAGTDEQIEWNVNEAIVGRDSPDPEFEKKANR